MFFVNQKISGSAIPTAKQIFFKRFSIGHNGRDHLTQQEEDDLKNAGFEGFFEYNKPIFMREFLDILSFAASKQWFGRYYNFEHDKETAMREFYGLLHLQKQERTDRLKNMGKEALLRKARWQDARFRLANLRSGDLPSPSQRFENVRLHRMGERAVRRAVFYKQLDSLQSQVKNNNPEKQPAPFSRLPNISELY